MLFLPIRHFLFLLLLTTSLFSEIIQTFYGPIIIEEPVLLELIHSAAMQRLKEVHQYGISYYTKTHPEEYTRFDHSLGVFTILRRKNASIEEQIAGLLHDVSHTAFSHVGDWVYAKEFEGEDYQSFIHDLYLTRSGIEEILNRHGYDLKQVSPKREEFLMLEQSLPHLCADRIDYNIQGAYFQKFLTKEEACTLLDDLSFENGNWLLTNEILAAKLVYFSLFMTENCWGSAENFMTSQWFANAIIEAMKTGIISLDDFQFGTDEILWSRLRISEDPSIQKHMHKVLHPHLYFHVVNPSKATTFIPFKSRGIDPWIKKEGKIVKLSSINHSLKELLEKTKERSVTGWPIEIIESR